MSSFWNEATIRELEAASISNFVGSVEFYGKVLDYGSGREPYRELVERGTAVEYVPYDRTDFPATCAEVDVGPDAPLDWNEHGWDVILCTQVVQYVPYVEQLFLAFAMVLRPGGMLVLTYPTCWDEVEPADLHRFTRAGMERILNLVGFNVERHERRAEVRQGRFKFALGYGVVARI